MTEEEFFRKNYPESCYGDRPLSPHWDFFQDGVEFGERQSEKQIAELKADNDARKFAMAMSENVEKQLREENEKLKTDYEVLSCSVGDFGELQDRLEEEQRKNNGLEEELKKWKDEWQEQVQKATDEGYARTLQTMQLTKAIEIIKKYLAIGVGGKITQNYLDVTKEAEQFLKEIKEK